MEAQQSVANSEMEDKSFWFQHRNSCIVQLVKKFSPRENGPIFGPENAKRTHGTNEGIMVAAMRQILAPEANSIARGERLAFGGSCLVAARKPLNEN